MKSRYIVCGAVNVSAVEADVALGTLTPEDAYDLVYDMFGVRLGRPTIGDSGFKGVDHDPRIPLEVRGHTMAAPSSCRTLTITSPNARKK